MRHRVRVSAAVVAAALLLVTATPALAKGGHGHHAVPIAGTATGEHWVEVGDPTCPAGAFQRFSSAGSGRLAHLGRVKYAMTQCTWIDPVTGRFPFGDGTTTFTAANGDTLVIAQEGISDVVGAMEGFTGEATWTVVGGTGRFASAKGSGTMEYVGDIPGGDALFGLSDGMMVVDLEGRIAYRASDRSR